MKLLPTIAAGLLLAAALGLSAAPAHADLITNGGFESGTYAFGGDGGEALPIGSTVINGWTVVSNSIAPLENGNGYGITANDGIICLDLTGYGDAAPYGGVTQTITTTSGVSYHLSFALGADQSNGSYSGPVGVTATAGNAMQTFTFDPATSEPNLTGNLWQTEGLDFTANSASTAITLIGAQGKQYIGLDSVSVTPNPVPEASTTVSFGLLLMLGLGGVMVAKKRKTA